MKIVITGSLGHIGSLLMRKLVCQFPTAHIFGVDNMCTQRYSSLFNLPALGSYHFIEGDIREIDLRPIFEGAHVVVHLAAMTDAAGSVDKAEQVENNNFSCTEKVAKMCLEMNCRLIALSSTSVYGSQSQLVNEECPDAQLRPQSPYASSKLKEERLVTSLHSDEGLKSVTCRFGTIYGASVGMRFHTAVNKFCWQAAMGQPITVWRTAYDQKRPYLDLTDAVNAISFIIRNDVFDGRIYNVVTENLTVRQVVETIREFVPRLEVSYVDNKIMNQLSYEVSAERIISSGFKFCGDLRTGVGATLSLLASCSRAISHRV